MGITSAWPLAPRPTPVPRPRRQRESGTAFGDSVPPKWQSNQNGDEFFRLSSPYFRKNGRPGDAFPEIRPANGRSPFQTGQNGGKSVPPPQICSRQWDESQQIRPAASKPAGIGDSFSFLCPHSAQAWSLRRGRSGGACLRPPSAAGFIFPGE